MKNLVLITGASSGIGYELAKLFAQDQYDLWLVARSQEKLEKLAQELKDRHHIQAHVLAKDLSQPEAPREIFQAVKQSGIPLNALVNNAGFGNYGFFKDSDLQRQLDMIQVNVTALTALTQLFLPGMVERGSGNILNVASTAAFQPGPLMAVYYATKAFVLHFSEALANELNGSGVKVTALCPGPTQSGFFQAAQMEDSGLAAVPYVWSSKSVAEFGYRAMKSGRRVAVPGFINKALAFSHRIGPRRYVTRIVRRIMNRRSG